MARKSLRELRIKARADGVRETADEALLLNKTLERLYTTISFSDKYFSALANAINPVAKGMKAVNTAMNSTKPKTKVLETYIGNLFDLTDSLELVENQALAAASALRKVDVSMQSTNTDRLTKALEELLEVTKENSQILDGMAASMETTSETLDHMWSVSHRTDESLETLSGTMRELGTRSARTNTNVDKTNNALRRMNGTGSSTTRGFSAMIGQMNPITAAYASIAINVYAVTEAFRILNEASNLNRLTEQMGNFSSAVSGLDVQSIAAQMRELAAGTLSVKESIQFATKGTAFNFTTEQLANLTKGAKRASIALGINFNDAMDRVLRGISKQEIELFDELGVVTRLTPAFTKYAGAIGKTVDQLTDYERQVALTNEVQRQLDERFKGIDIAATGWEKLGVATQDATTSGLQYIADVLDPAATYISDLLNSGKILRDSTVISDKSVTQAETFTKAFESGAIGQAINSVGSLREEIDKLTKQAEDFENESKRLTNSLKGVFENGSFSDQAILLSNAFQQIILDIAGFEQAAVVASGDVGKATALAKSANKTKAELVKLNAQLLEQQKKLVEQEGLDINIITPETGQAVISFINNLRNTKDGLDALVLTAQKPKNDLQDLVDLADKFTQKIDSVPDTVYKLAVEWNKFAETNKIALNVGTVEAFAAAVRKLGADLESVSFQDALSTETIGNVQDADLKVLESSLLRRRDILKQITDLGKTISVDTKLKYEQELQILEVKIKNLRKEKELKQVLDEKEIKDSAALYKLEQQTTLESAKLELQIQQAEAEKAILALRGMDTREIEKQIALMRERLKLSVIPTEERAISSAGIGLAIQRAETEKGRVGSEVERVAIQERILELRQAEIDLMPEGIEKTKALLEIERQREETAKKKASAPFIDASNLFETLQNLEGLSAFQQIGLDIGNTFTEAFAKATEAGVSFTEYLSNNAEAFRDFSISIANAASQMYSQLADDKIASINLEIDAEKRRDGKSAESLEKIRRLEAKKIKEKQKANVAQAGMSTAVAIMNAMSELPYPYNFVAAAAAGVLGALQIANINKAAAGQIANLSATPSAPASVTVGNARSNSVDISKAASAGELAFLTGSAGTGTNANNFTPGKAGGGTAYAGSSYMVGERGPELLTPLTPTSVTPAGEVGKGGGNNFTVSLNISAIDSASFAETAEQNAVAFWNAVEKEANSRGVSLNNL